MCSRQLGEKDLRVTPAIESGSVDLDVSMGMEGGEEGGDVVGTADANEGVLCFGGLETEGHCP